MMAVDWTTLSMPGLVDSQNTGFLVTQSQKWTNCHGGGGSAISNPESENSILLGTGALPLSRETAYGIRSRDIYTLLGMSYLKPPMYIRN